LWSRWAAFALWSGFARRAALSFETSFAGLATFTYRAGLPVWTLRANRPALLVIVDTAIGRRALSERGCSGGKICSCHHTIDVYDIRTDEC
jgi:hypothetical protein